jgi:long-chain alkane monooxygenase
MTRRFHLVQYLMPPVQHHSMVTWKHPRNMLGGVYRWDRPEVWQEVARICEQARYDAIFFADTEGVYSEWQGSHEAAVRYAAQAPCFEPTVLMTYLAAVTTRLGLAFTLNATSYPPYVTARKFATLDHLSNGRAAWNVVTGFHHAAFQNLGLPEIIEHDERYDRADEYLEVCYRLWESWDEDAVVMDAARDMFADPAKVHAIDFEGRWYRCRGPLNIHRSPQVRPLIVQAGSSDRGREFAARHAEMIFTIQPGIDAMKSYYDDVKSRMMRGGRDPDTCKIMYGLQTFVGETEAIAREKAEFHNAMATPEAGLVWMSGTAGYDFSGRIHNLDDPAEVLSGVQAQGIRGARERRLLPADGHGGAPPRVRDVGLRSARGAFLQVVGTGEQVADWMETAIDTVGGDGFFLSPAYIPGSIEEFAGLVVPILQRRGLVRTEYINGTLRDNLLAF